MKQLVTACICFWAYLAAAQTYPDSIRQLRVLHFAELTDPAKKILTEDEIAHFEGLDYFLIDTTYIIEANFIRKKGKKFKMPTTTSRSPVYRRFGFVQFQLNGMEHKLTVFQNMELKRQEGYANYLFLPFRDSSSGNESYGGGRYLDLVIPKGKKIILDFNLAYNPYCVYSDRYSCPIPPEENRLKTAIRAGEKKPKAY
jgi:uncharacterized protein (DUF1684 family)